MLPRCEHVVRDVRADSGAILGEFNGRPDHVHLQQGDVGRLEPAPTAGHVQAPSSFAASCGGAPLEIVKEYTRGHKRPG